MTLHDWESEIDDAINDIKELAPNCRVIRQDKNYFSIYRNVA